jgi:hypothetical protein
MKRIRADLHIHTVLSPCGDLDMSPVRIIHEAVKKGIGIIGITDHNSLKQVDVVEDLAARHGIFVLGGAEVTTREEIHCLAFFPDRASRNEFQDYIDNWQPFIRNREHLFGHQVVVDDADQILFHEEKLLLTALPRNIHEIEIEVHRLGGIFIPAHIDKPVNSIFSQLGFIPEHLCFDALEISCFTTAVSAREKYNLSDNIALVKNSDAHYPGDIGKGLTDFMLSEYNFDEIKLALAGKEGRTVITG